MEVGKSAVQITDVSEELEDEDAFVENREEEEEGQEVKTGAEVAMADIFQVQRLNRIKIEKHCISFHFSRFIVNIIFMYVNHKT